MKTTKLLIITLVLGAMAGSPAIAQTVTRTTARPSLVRSTTMASHWNHHRYYRPRSNFYFGIGLGYPYSGYGYGYYAPRTTVYATSNINDDATVAAVQRRLARGGYYHGSVDGVIGPGTRSAIRAFERNNGLPVDGLIDRQLLRTMGIA